MPSVNFMDPISQSASEATNTASYGAKGINEMALGRANLQQQKQEHQDMVRQAELERMERQWDKQMEMRIMALNADYQTARMETLKSTSLNAAEAAEKRQAAYSRYDDVARKYNAAKTAAAQRSMEADMARTNLKENLTGQQAAKTQAMGESLTRSIKAVSATLQSGFLDEQGNLHDTTMLLEQLDRAQMPKAIRQFIKSYSIAGDPSGVGGALLEQEDEEALTSWMTSAWTLVGDTSPTDDLVQAVELTGNQVGQTVPPEIAIGIIEGLKSFAVALREGTPISPEGGTDAKATLKTMRSNAKAAARVDQLVEKLRASIDLPSSEEYLAEDVKLADDVAFALGDGVLSKDETDSLRKKFPQAFKPGGRVNSAMERLQQITANAQSEQEEMQLLQREANKWLDIADNIVVQAQARGDADAAEQAAEYMRELSKLLGGGR